MSQNADGPEVEELIGLAKCLAVDWWDALEEDVEMMTREAGGR